MVSIWSPHKKRHQSKKSTLLPKRLFSPFLVYMWYNKNQEIWRLEASLISNKITSENALSKLCSWQATEDICMDKLPYQMRQSNTPAECNTPQDRARKWKDNINVIGSFFFFLFLCWLHTCTDKYLHQSWCLLDLILGCDTDKTHISSWNLFPSASILNPFANMTSISVQTCAIWGLRMSALTDSFPLPHITNHLLSTYPVFKAIFSPDGRSVAWIKVKSESHLPVSSLNKKP